MGANGLMGYYLPATASPLTKWTEIYMKENLSKYQSFTDMMAAAAMDALVGSRTADLKSWK